MRHPNDPFRGTGRTTRMLFEAAAEVAKGKRVFVVTASYRDHEYMRVLLDSHGIKLGRNASLRFISVGNLDALRGLREETVAVFVDHYVYESASSRETATIYEYRSLRPGLFP